MTMSDSDTVAIERAEGTLLGKPLAYRAASAARRRYRPLAAFQFRRTERVRLEWPVLQAVESHAGAAARSHRQAAGHSADDRHPGVNGVPMVATDLNLAPLSNGDYLIEVARKPATRPRPSRRDSGWPSR